MKVTLDDKEEAVQEKLDISLRKCKNTTKILDSGCASCKLYPLDGVELALSAAWDLVMGVLNINDLKTGMVLAQSAKNKHGVVILGKGNVLTEKHIHSFKAWGITGVNIKDIDGDQVIKQEMEALPNDIVESIEKELR